jgi:hypothetical protein
LLSSLILKIAIVIFWGFVLPGGLLDGKWSLSLSVSPPSLSSLSLLLSLSLSLTLSVSLSLYKLDGIWKI